MSSQSTPTRRISRPANLIPAAPAQRTFPLKTHPDPQIDRAWADARALNLCADHTAADPRAALRGSPLQQPAAADDGPGPLPDAFPVQSDAPPKLTERLKVSAGAAALLARVIGVVGLDHAPRSDDDDDDNDASSPPFRRADSPDRPRLEPPLLATDPDADVRAAQRRWADPLGWWARRGGVLGKGRLWPVDERAGEGLAWPQGLDGFSRRTEEGMWHEKMSLSRGAAGYLVRIMEDKGEGEWEPGEVDWVGSSSWSWLALTGLQMSRMETMLSPPLLPWPYDEVDVELEPPRFDLELISGESDDVDPAEELERKIEQMDPLQISCDTTKLDLNFDVRKSDPMDILNPPAILNEGEATPRKRKIDELEVPLLPADDKQLKLSDGKDTLAQHLHTAVPWTTPHSEPSSDGAATLTNLLAPLAAKADQMAAQENLNSKRSSLRLPVPLVDRSPPVLPWEKYGRAKSVERFESELDAQKRLIRDVFDTHLAAVKEWPGAKAVERRLVWRPFPREFAAVGVDEKMEDTGYLLALLQALRSDEPTIRESNLQMPERLRILDPRDDEDDEISFAHFDDEEMDVDYVLRKGAISGPPAQSRWNPSPPSKIGAKRATESLEAPGAKRYKPEVDIFSASSLLQRFFALKGVIIAPSADKAQPGLQDDPADQRRAKVTRPPQIKNVLPRAPPLPPLPPDKPPRVVIASTDLLTTKRPLLQALQALYPSLTLLERDFSTLVPTPDYLRSPLTTSGTAPDHVLAEADLILSPTTGLVLTTLQKISQLPLPGRGQKHDLPPFHARLRALSGRYPRLTVLVSQGIAPPPGILSASVLAARGNPAEPRAAAVEEKDDGGDDDDDDVPISASATRALARLLGAAARCAPASLVAVQLVPGGDAALARWAAWHALRSGAAPTTATTPSAAAAASGGQSAGGGGGEEDEYEAGFDAAALRDETAAEAILRRAGLNAFAAAAVLARLRRRRRRRRLPPAFSPPDGSGGHVDPPTPLAAFVAMDPRRRTAEFARLLGGAAVVERVGRVLEQRWISASDGFAR
jgi:hypothetical protein